MNITLNGKPFEVPPQTTLAQLVALRKIQTPAYAIERNKEVVFRKEQATTRSKSSWRSAGAELHLRFSLSMTLY
jgi:thiamine biosynthesis protein ThiS